MTVRPITFAVAKAYINEVHRHLSAPTGWLFGVGLYDGDKLVGVGTCGRPVARMLQDGVTCEITRIATTGEYKNACSMMYGALRRAASALGYTRIITYTRDGELGASCRSAGFVLDGHSAGGEWSVPSRKREKAEDPSPKTRWVWRRHGVAA